MFNPEIHHRHSIRLRDFDYSGNGAYFVTICTQGRECLFGDIVDGGMCVNDAGWMVEMWWRKLPEKFDNVIVDSHITMPNHFHGIIRIVGAAPCGRPVVQDHVGADPCVCPPLPVVHGAHTSGAHMGAPLHRMVQWFKTMTTNAYIRGVKDNCWLPFSGRLWQRNYYERIIRDEDELASTREYIEYNPMRWSEDRENPDSAEM